jgi:tetratricopeptide (TPR) repeat protein
MRLAEELMPGVDDLFIQGWWAVIGAMWYSWRGRFDEAVKIHVHWHRIAGGGSYASVVNSWAEGLARCGKGEYEQALALAEVVITTGKRIGEGFFWARGLNSMGWIYGELQDYRQAMALNTQGIEAALEISAPNMEIESNARVNLGENLLALGRLDEAEEHFRKVEKVVRNPRPQDIFMLWRYKQRMFHSYGELWLARGDLNKALAYADECLALAEQSKSQKNIVKGRRLKGQVFQAQGKLAEAGRELSIALEVAERISNPTQLWKTYATLGDLRQAQGRPDDARRGYGDAVSVIEEVASGLKDKSLRDTFMGSHVIQEIVQKAESENGSG